MAFISGDSDGEMVLDKSDGVLNNELPSTADPLKYNADVPQNNELFKIIILDKNGEPQVDADGNLTKVKLQIQTILKVVTMSPFQTREAMRNGIG